MHNTASQNPSNRAARNSGAGPGGVSEVVPTAAEARRGLTPFTREDPGTAGRLLALVLTAAAGAVVAGAAVWRSRRQQPLGRRILRRVGAR